MPISPYHLWCYYNSLVIGSVKFCIFQRELTRDATKLYMKLHNASYSDYASLVKKFLNHFQLPLRQDFGTNFLSTFK